jgi:hypothetical protein
MSLLVFLLLLSVSAYSSMPLTRGTCNADGEIHETLRVSPPVFALGFASPFVFRFLL